MSAFDEAMRKQSAARQAAEDADAAELRKRHEAAEAAVPRIQGLLREFAQRLAASGVQPTRVTLKDAGKWGFGAKKSPAGYVLHNNSAMYGPDRKVALVTPAGELFVKGFTESGEILPITAQNIFDGNVYCAGRVEVRRDGFVGIETSIDPEAWESLEDNIARMAIKIIEHPELNQ